MLRLVSLSLAATTASKNVIYGLGQHYTPVDLGLQIGGTPEGSFDYMVESVNKTVDAIISELQQFERISMGRMECYVPEYRLYLQ